MNPQLLSSGHCSSSPSTMTNWESTKERWTTLTEPSCTHPLTLNCTCSNLRYTRWVVWSHDVWLVPAWHSTLETCLRQLAGWTKLAKWTLLIDLWTASASSIYWRPIKQKRPLRQQGSSLESVDAAVLVIVCWSLNRKACLLCKQWTTCSVCGFSRS